MHPYDEYFEKRRAKRMAEGTDHINCRCTSRPTIRQKLPKVSAEAIDSAHRVVKRDAEIFRRAAEGSNVAQSVLALAASRLRFTRN